MSFDKTQYTRTIYGFFDWLGDVGGLNDMLFLVGAQISGCISFLAGSGLNRLLVYNIFKTDGPDHGHAELSDNVIMNHVRKRVPLKIRLCKWLAPC